MLRKFAVFLAILLSSLATQVFALGLGTVTVDSALNQPLRVRIEILQLGDTRLQDVTVQMASLADFQRFNIDRVGFLSNIQFSIASTPDGNFVTLTSNQIVREPYLSFILDTRWPNGRLLSEHTILLDLPVFDDQQPSAAVRQPISPVLQPPATPTQPPATPAVTPPAPAVTPPETTSTAPAAEPDEPAEVAEEPAPAPEPAVEPEPEPEPEVVAVPDEPAPAEPVDATAAPDSADAEPATIATSADDTLSDIALQVRPNESVSMQQTMLAIQRLNPDAFIGGNINRLRAEQVLQIPDLAEIQSVAAQEAAAEIARQNQEFANADVQPLAAPAPQSAAQDTTPQGQLSVVTADDDDAIDASSGAGTLDDAENAALDQRIAELENQLAVQQEEADRARLERDELDARMDELEAQIAAAQEIIRLQDIQLAQLQDSLAQAAAEQAEQLAAIAAAEAQMAEQAASRTSLTGDIMRLLTGNILFIGAGLALVVLLLVVLLLRRNRANVQESDIDELDADEFMPKDSSNDDDEEKFQDYDEDELDSELDQIIGVDADSDVIKQATGLLSKGSFTRAISLLQTALDKSPDDNQIRMKLLEAFAAQGDLSAFEEQADIIGDDPEFNAQINALRRNIKVKEVQQPVKAPEPSKKTTSTAEEDRLGAASFLDDLGIDLDAFDDDDEEPSVTERSVKPEPVPVEPEKKPAKPKPEPAPEPAPEPSLDDDSFLADEMDLTFDLVGDVEPAVDIDADEKDVAQAGAGDEAAAEIDLEADEPEPVDTEAKNAEVALEFDVSDTPDTKSESDSKDADEIEIEAFEFDVDKTPAAAAAAEEESEIELETFAFDTEGLDKPAEPAPEAEAAPAADEENLLDFDFDKTEIEAPSAKQEATAADDLETFEFDVDENPVATVVETPEEDTVLDIDTDDFDLDDDDEAATKEEDTADEEGFLDLDALAGEESSAASGSDAEIEIEYDFDDDAASDTDDIATEATDSLADELDAELDDLDFLSGEDEVEIESVEEADAMDSLSDVDEVATKLELAYAYRKMGDVEGAKEILQEVVKEGTPEQVKEANELMSSLDDD